MAQITLTTIKDRAWIESICHSLSAYSISFNAVRTHPLQEDYCSIKSTSHLHFSHYWHSTHSLQEDYTPAPVKPSISPSIKLKAHGHNLPSCAAHHVQTTAPPSKSNPSSSPTNACDSYGYQQKEGNPQNIIITITVSSSMEKLIEVDSHEILVDFQLSTKCRVDVLLRSLHPSLPVAFKVQTSSPHKFLVNPPSALLPPLSSLSFQIILRPQPSLPSSFPRSPSDRFLVKAAAVSSHSLDIPSFFSSHPHLPTHDLKLKVVYVGTFLLRHSISSANLDAAKHILRRQRSLLSSLTPPELQTLARSRDPDILNLLGGADAATGTILTPAKSIHEAAAGGSYEDVVEIVRGRDAAVDERDGEGRTALHVAAGKGYVRCVRALVELGADKDAKSGRDGRTALHRAAANGDGEMVALLLEMGADPSISNARGRTPLDVARDKGHKEVIEVLERGELVLTAARRGDLKRLESLLKKGIGANSHDQYGMTALHSAAIKGHRDIVCMLAEFGMDLECQDVEGHTPLHLGVEGGWLEIVEVLVEMGADVNATSKRGATPLYMARSMGYEDISQLLMSKGASCSTMASSSSLSSTSYA